MKKYRTLYLLLLIAFIVCTPRSKSVASTTDNSINDLSSYTNFETTSTEINKKIDKLSVDINIDAYVADEVLSDEGSDGGDIIIYADQEGSSHFKVDEFTTYDGNPSKETISKIQDIHIPQLEKVRSAINKPIVIRSASRTVEHEKKKGRSGKSQHIFPKGKGAVDISTPKYSAKELDELEKAIFQETDYNRVSRYKSYLHLDYAKNRSGSRSYYRNSQYGWIYVGDIKDR